LTMDAKDVVYLAITFVLVVLGITCLVILFR